jgi:hypothetical protein
MQFDWDDTSETYNDGKRMRIIGKSRTLNNVLFKVAQTIHASNTQRWWCLWA